jgi:hypothetical protein
VTGEVEVHAAADEPEVRPCGLVDDEQHRPFPMLDLEQIDLGSVNR